MTGPVKRVCVAFALPQRQWQWNVVLPAEATVADALAAARAQGAPPGMQIDWNDAATGVHGVVVDRRHVCADGDRIEIYRPLADDPRSRRRRRVEQSRRGQRS